MKAEPYRQIPHKLATKLQRVLFFLSTVGYLSNNFCNPTNRAAVRKKAVVSHGML